MNTFWCQISYQMVNVRGLIDDIAFAQPQSTDVQRRRSAKQESLQAEWDQRNEKLKQLRMDLVSETDTATKFKL